MAARGRAAQPGWEAYGFEGRARVLLRAQKWVMDNAEQVVETIVSETGKTFEDAELAEIGYAGNAFGFWAKNAAGVPRRRDGQVQPGARQGQEAHPALPPARADRRDRAVELPADELLRRLHPRARGRQQRDPQALRGHAADLAADGRRPARVRPARERPADRHRPRGDRRRADRARRHDHVHRLDGDRAQGRARRPRRLIPASLELGGKDPMIVLSDADLERAANFATYYSMQNAGQTCISIERVYVEEPVYDEFVAKVSEKVARAAQSASRRGPGRSRSARSRSRRRWTRSRTTSPTPSHKGARVLTGGHQAPGAGRFFEPTVLVDVDHTMKCMTEETFGPTLPIMKVARRRRGGAARQRLALRPRRVGVLARTPSAARRSRGGIRPARPTSTTR